MYCIIPIFFHFPSCLYLNCLHCMSPTSTIFHHLPYHIPWGRTHFCRMKYNLLKGMQGIKRWSSGFGAAFCTKLTIVRGSSVGCIVLDLVCLCFVASVPKLIFFLLAVMIKTNTRRIFEFSCYVLMCTFYPNLFHRLPSCMVLSVISISLSALVIDRMIRTCSYVPLAMPDGLCPKK